MPTNGKAGRRGVPPMRMPTTLTDYALPLENLGGECAPLPCALLPVCPDADRVRALLMRLEQAGKIRNIGAHGGLSMLKTTAGDGLHIMEILGIFVDWAAHNRPGKDTSDQAPLEIKLFWSVGQPHRPNQKQFLEKLRSELKREGVDLVNPATAEYSIEKLLPQ